MRPTMSSGSHARLVPRFHFNVLFCDFLRDIPRTTKTSMIWYGVGSPNEHVLIHIPHYIDIEDKNFQGKFANLIHH